MPFPFHPPNAHLSLQAELARDLLAIFMDRATRAADALTTLHLFSSSSTPSSHPGTHLPDDVAGLEEVAADLLRSIKHGSFEEAVELCATFRDCAWYLENMVLRHYRTPLQNEMDTQAEEAWEALALAGNAARHLAQAICAAGEEGQGGATILQSLSRAVELDERKKAQNLQYLEQPEVNGYVVFGDSESDSEPESESDLC